MWSVTTSFPKYTWFGGHDLLVFLVSTDGGFLVRSPMFDFTLSVGSYLSVRLEMKKPQQKNSTYFGQIKKKERKKGLRKKDRKKKGRE